MDENEKLDPTVMDDIQETWKSLSGNEAVGETIKESAHATKSPSGVTVRERAIRNSDAPVDPPPDYEIIEKLGEGGMGVIYTARQSSVDRIVALKMVKGAEEQKQKDMFLSEAVATSNLDHPNIVPIHDLGANDSGQLFYSMKKVQGTPWSDVVRSKSRQENLDILMRVCDATAFAHSRSVIHRDLKPENVMLGDFGEIYVMDWGLAAAVDETGKAQPLSEDTAAGGTPAYMAPEMGASDFTAIGRHSDVYLLGAILYEIVTGSPPHTGTTIYNCIYNVMQNIITDTEETGELVDIALRAMSTAPEERHAGILDFQQAVRDYLSHAESILLTAAARETLKRDPGEYKTFTHAIAGFEQAVELWPGNKEAASGLAQTRLTYAETAYTNGDLDLAGSLLDPGAEEEKELLSRIETAKKKRLKRQRRMKMLTGGIIAAAIIIAAGSATAALWIQAEKNKTQSALERVSDEQEKTAAALGTAQTERDRAETARDRAEKAEEEAVQNKDAAEKARDEAAEEARRAKAVKDFIQETLGSVDPGVSGKDVRVVDALDRAAGLVDERFEKDLLIRSDLHYTISFTYHGLGAFDKAHTHAQKSHAIRKDDLGAEDPETLESKTLIAGALFAKGKYKDAEKVHREVLETRKRVLGPEHPETLLSLSNVAGDLLYQAKYDEAEKLERQALEIKKRVLGPKNPQTLLSMHNLANNYGIRGKYAEAEKMFREVWEIESQILGLENPRTLTGLGNLGNTLFFQGKYKEAEKIHRKVLEIETRVLGPEHPNTLMSKGALADDLSLQGRLKESEKMCREVLAQMTKVLGPEHPDTLTAMSSLARDLAKQRKFAEAEKLDRRTMELMTKKLGPDHPNTLMVIANLGRNLYLQRKFKEAEELLIPAVKTHNRVLGPVHPQTRTVITLLKQVQVFRGRKAGPEELGKENLAKIEKQYGKNHKKTYAAYREYGEALLKARKMKEAEGAAREAMTIIKTLADAAPEDARLKSMLAWELLTSPAKELRDRTEALALSQKAAELSREKDPGVLYTLSLCLYRNEKVQESIDMLEKAISVLPANIAPGTKRLYDFTLKQIKAVQNKKEEAKVDP
ncbi:tetratricopeptide repeat protein [Planctomycetota bacterium]